MESDPCLAITLGLPLVRDSVLCCCLLRAVCYRFQLKDHAAIMAEATGLRSSTLIGCAVQVSGCFEVRPLTP